MRSGWVVLMGMGRWCGGRDGCSMLVSALVVVAVVG